MRAINLRCEHSIHPMGIDVTHPYLSWNCSDGKRQTAYEIEAKKGEVVWNSGKVESQKMHAIYEGNLTSRDAITWRVRLWDEEEQVSTWSEEAHFELGLLNSSDWQAQWINPELTCDPEAHKPASYLRKTFFYSSKDTIGASDCTLSTEMADEKGMSDITNARLYITAHGLYEVSINGTRVGDFVLAPGSYDYDKHIAYQTYDVTSLLRDGENVIEVILGDGWYRSVSGVDGDRNLYGTDVALFCQLEVDGTVICVTDESWEASQEGPIRENDMQQGEVVDARKEEITNYHKVLLMETPVHSLIGTNSVPIVENERFEGKLIHTPNGETVLDFGQNLAGYIEFSITAKAGDTLTLTHGETLDENGNFTQENFQDRKRHKEGGTRQQVIYTCREGENHYKTKFSTFGFRYAKVETSVDLSQAKFYAIAVYSQMERLTEFTCGNADVNQLYQNAIWSQKSNFCDVPTDCPTRERAAWTGDMNVFAHTGLYLMDAYPVIKKWLAECRLAQYEDGRVANIAPRNNNPSFFSGLLAGSVGWGDACINVPYTLYLRDGDVRILEANYEMMKRWVGYLERRSKKSPMNPLKRIKRNPYRNYTIETGIDYGEWCEPDVEATSAMRTPQGKVATAYLAHSSEMLAEIACILGEDEDAASYQKLAKNAKKAWHYIATEDGKIRSDRQADFVRALRFGLLEGEEAKTAAADLNALVEKCGYHLNTGFLSTPDLTCVLCDYGYEDTAYKLLLQDTYPSWLYEVKKGATTIWECWDGVAEDGRVKASLNHYSYGAICGWLIDSVCGIRVADGKITITPYPHPSLGYAKASYESPYGRIESGWHYEGEHVVYDIKVPANVPAEVHYPDGRVEEIASWIC